MRTRMPALVSAMLAAVALSPASQMTGRALADPPTKETGGAALNSDVAALLKQVNGAYSKLKSYQHTEIYSVAAKGPQGDIKQTQKVLLAMERPNKFLYNAEKAGDDVAVSNGKTFITFRKQTGEYTKMDAPATFKGINIVDGVQFQANGSYLIALALQGDILADKDMTEMLAHSKLGQKLTENGKTYQTLVYSPGNGQTITFSIDADTHLLSKSVQRAAAQGFTLTEEFTEVKLNKPIDAAVFNYTPPEKAKLVAKFTDPREQADAEEKALLAKFVDKPAPDFTVQDREGHEIKLSSMKGKVVVVDFWASWCGPCRQVMPFIQEIHDKYKDKDVAVMAVDTWDKKEDCEKFLKDNTKYTMPVLLDPAADKESASIASTLYGVQGIPTTLFIDKEGIVRTYALGSHPRDFYMNALKKMGVQIASSK